MTTENFQYGKNVVFPDDGGLDGFSIVLDRHHEPWVSGGVLPSQTFQSESQVKTIPISEQPIPLSPFYECTCRELLELNFPSLVLAHLLTCKKFSSTKPKEISSIEDLCSKSTNLDDLSITKIIFDKIYDKLLVNPHQQTSNLQGFCSNEDSNKNESLFPYNDPQNLSSPTHGSKMESLFPILPMGSSEKYNLPKSQTNSDIIMASNFNKNQNFTGEDTLVLTIGARRVQIAGQLGRENSVDIDSYCVLCNKKGRPNELFKCKTCRSIIGKDCISQEVLQYLSSLVYGACCPVKDCQNQFNKKELKTLVGEDIYELLENSYKFTEKLLTDDQCFLRLVVFKCSCGVVLSVRNNSQLRIASDHFLGCEQFRITDKAKLDMLSQIFRYDTQQRSNFLNQRENDLGVVKILFDHFYQ
jgi:hypothetical protein